MQIPTVSCEVIVSAVVHLTGPLSEDNFRIAFRFMESDCIADTSSDEHTHTLFQGTLKFNKKFNLLWDRLCCFFLSGLLPQEPAVRLRGGKTKQRPFLHISYSICHVFAGVTTIEYNSELLIISAYLGLYCISFQEGPLSRSNLEDKFAW